MLAAGVGVMTTLLLALAQRILLGAGVMDVPNHRSSHQHPVVRGGGVGIIAGLLLGLAASTWASGQFRTELVVVLLATLFSSLIGLADDLAGARHTDTGLSVRLRMLAQIATTTAAAVGFWISTMLPWWQIPVVVLVGVCYINATNFMDGVNGISGLHGLITGLSYYFYGRALDAPPLGAAALVLAISFAVFVPWNFSRTRRMFMGDVGSYGLGCAVWALAVWTLSLTEPRISTPAAWLAAGAPLLIYGVDVVFTLLRRAIRGEQLTEAHREHVYQKIQQGTGSHLASTLWCSVGTALSGAVGLWMLLRPTDWLLAVAALSLIVVIYLLGPLLLRTTETKTA